MSNSQYLFLVLSMAAVTFVPRYIPMFLANRLVLPKFVEQALTYVPIAILTIIVVQTVLYKDQVLLLTWQNPYIGGSIAAFIAAILQKRLFVTIAVGLLTYCILKLWLSL